MVVASGLYVLYNDLRPWKRMMCSIVYEYISCWQAVVVMYWLIIRSLLLYCKHFSAFLVTIAYAIRSSSKLECDTTYILHHFANGWRITSCTWAIWLGAKSTLHSGRLSVVYHYSLSLGQFYALPTKLTRLWKRYMMQHLNKIPLLSKVPTMSWANKRFQE